MSENINNNENFDNAVSGVEVVPKKKGKKIALISGITAVALVGGGAAAYNLSDYVKNQVNLRVMKPANYYAWVTEENSKEFAAKARENYAKAYDKAQNGQSASVTLSYKASEEFKDYALNEILGEQYNEYDDEESKSIVKIITNLDEFSIGCKADVKDNLISGNAFAKLNGETLVNSDMAFDMENFDYFLRVPELTEQWLCMAMGESMSDYLIGTESLMKNPYEYISPEQLEDLIIRYTNIWNETVSDVEVEKKETLDICDITVEYTVVSAELNEAKLAELFTNYLNEIRNDEVIKNIVVNEIGEYTEEEYYEEIDDMLNEIAEEDTSNNDKTATVNTYIDPNGDIRGIRFTANDEEVFIGLGKDGDNVRGEMYFADENEKDFSIELYADETDGKYNGNIDFTEYYSCDESETVSIEFTDYEVVNEDKGYVNANVTFIIPDVDPIAVDFSTDGSSQDISYNINFDGTDYGTVTLSLSADDSAEVSIPSKDGAFVISPYMDSEPALEDYIPQENMKNFIYDILIKIGFSEELAQDGADDMMEEMYYDYDDNDWETYDSDIDWDDFAADFDYDDFDEDFSVDSDVWNPNEEGMFSTGEITDDGEADIDVELDDSNEWFRNEQYQETNNA
ncbi:MAG: hypothetical protein K2J40_09675 [Ruminococcus sp.]|nr:hypothetical protein [Ruminococcus sp.]